MDMRGHGGSTSPDDADLSKATLTADITALWRSLYAAEAPPTVIMGHSVGGALSVWAALEGGIATLEGMVVVDVVEGTAICAPLPSP